MKWYFFCKITLFCVGLWGLSACQNPPHQERDYPVSAASIAAPGSKIYQKLMPGVILQGVEARTVLNTVVRERLKKRMAVKQRDNYSLIMTIKIPNTRKPTEANMIYTLYRYQNGLWLTARVYQITDPGSDTETVLDVTPKAGKELQLELEKIAQRWTRE